MNPAANSRCGSATLGQAACVFLSISHKITMMTKTTQLLFFITLVAVSESLVSVQ